MITILDQKTKDIFLAAENLIGTVFKYVPAN